MGILERVYGNNQKSDEENKWAIFLNLCNQVMGADGVFSDEESLFSRTYLQNKAPNFTNSDWDRICANAESMGPEGMVKARELTEDDKYELINYLSGIASSDGKFDGKEFTLIYAISGMIGLDKNKINDILSNFDNIDFDDAEKQMNEMVSRMKNAGLK